MFEQFPDRPPTFEDVRMEIAPGRPRSEIKSNITFTIIFAWPFVSIISFIVISILKVIFFPSPRVSYYDFPDTSFPTGRFAFSALVAAFILFMTVGRGIMRAYKLIEYNEKEAERVYFARVEAYEQRKRQEAINDAAYRREQVEREKRQAQYRREQEQLRIQEQIRREEEQRFNERHRAWEQNMLWAYSAVERAYHDFALQLAAQEGVTDPGDVVKVFGAVWPSLPIAADWRMGCLHGLPNPTPAHRAVMPYLPPLDDRMRRPTK